MTVYAALWGAVLNKVIHRPVESIGKLKIIFGLPAILMFHFNFAPLFPMSLSNGLPAGLSGSLVQ
jgi:hypothetical protein